MAILGHVAVKDTATEYIHPQDKFADMVGIEMMEVLGRFTMWDRATGYVQPPGEITTMMGEELTRFLKQAQKLHLPMRVNADHWRFVHLPLRDFFAFLTAVRILRDMVARVALESIGTPDALAAVRKYHRRQPNER